MATIPSVQLFRNSKIKTGRQAAIDALEAQKASVPDGGLILARYSDDGSENGVKTLLGIVRNGGGTNAQLTIIDVEGAAKNVQEAIHNYNLHPTQKQKVNPDGTTIVTFEAGGRYEICWHLFRWGKDVKILEPQELKDTYKKLLDDALGQI